jgi:transketolase C-terminal domain/subunit
LLVIENIAETLLILYLENHSSIVGVGGRVGLAASIASN